MGRKLRIHAGAADGVSAQVTGAITAMPAWQQVLLLEAGGDLIAAGQEETLRLYKSIRPNCDSKPQGFFASGYKHPLDATDAIVWYASADHESMCRMTHELAHFTGELIAQHYVALARAESWEKPRLLSQLPWWREALEKQLQQPMHDADLYDHRTAPSFQKMLEKYPPDERAEEAFAEISGHYSILMMDAQGDKAQVDGVLSHAYPILWPVFRDRVIPLGEALAETLIQQRRDRAPEPMVASVRRTGAAATAASEVSTGVSYLQ